MIWLEKETPKGIIKYRMPNIIEAYELFDATGVMEKVTSPVLIKKNIIKNMANLLDLNGVYLSYEEALFDIDNIVVPFSEIAEILADKVFGIYKKKP